MPAISSFKSKKKNRVECVNTQLDLFDHDVIKARHNRKRIVPYLTRKNKRHNMENREIKGKEIANASNVIQQNGLWFVKSESKTKQYTVNLNKPSCNCADYQNRQLRCKHIYAVVHFLLNETGEKVVLPKQPKRKTYSQDNWSAYHAAQVNEKEKLQLLLNELCKGIQEPLHTFGRPRMKMADMVFAIVYKVYSTFSGRRFMYDLREAKDKGYLSKLPSYNSIFDYFQLESLTPCLEYLITKSAEPLKEVEINFAVDSSGFSTGQTVSWTKVKYGKEEIIEQKTWLKAHIICGVQTNIITSVQVTPKLGGDSTNFPQLVNQTAQTFNMKSVSADGAYSSKPNLKLVQSKSATPYIPFDVRTVTPEKEGIWRDMYFMYKYNEFAFMEHYGKRSNVESTFSMLKRKFGERLRSKTETSQKNELLAKVLCHNICVLINSMFELGIDPQFWKERL